MPIAPGTPQYAAWYQRNKIAITKRNEVTRQRNKAFVTEWKLSHGCFDCGYNLNPAALDCHHEGLKREKLSQANSRSLRWVKEELSQCLVLCANCHRIRHAAAGG